MALGLPHLLCGFRMKTSNNKPLRTTNHTSTDKCKNEHFLAVFSRYQSQNGHELHSCINEINQSPCEKTDMSHTHVSNKSTNQHINKRTWASLVYQTIHASTIEINEVEQLNTRPTSGYAYG